MPNGRRPQAAAVGVAEHGSRAALTPLAAAGHTAPPWQEAAIAAGFVSVGVAMVVSAILVLWGLRRTAAV